MESLYDTLIWRYAFLMSRLAAYLPILWLRMHVKPSPMSWPLATWDMTEKISTEFGTFEVESLNTLKGVDAEVEDEVKFNLLKRCGSNSRFLISASVSGTIVPISSISCICFWNSWSLPAFMSLLMTALVALRASSLFLLPS